MGGGGIFCFVTVKLYRCFDNAPLTGIKFCNFPFRVWQNINKEVDVCFVYFMILTLEALIKHCETAIISQCLLSHF